MSARKFRFRKRMLMAMAVLLLASGVAAYLVSPTFWWACGSVGAVTILYLGYLRRQTRIEEQVRRRRAQRMMRSHLGVENTNDPEYDVVPARLRRPGAVVLEIDDEDPIFEHLDYAPFAREYDLPRRGRAVARFSRAAPALVACATGTRGYSAVGSASRSHREGQGFDSP